MAKRIKSREELLAEFDDMLVYNGRDCAITRQVFDVISPQLFANDEHSVFRARTYRAEQSFQAAALEIMCRGIRIDPRRLWSEQQRLRGQLARLRESLDFLVKQLVPEMDILSPKGVSPKSLKSLLHEHFAYPVVVQSYKGEKRETLDREAIEKLIRENEELTPLLGLVTGIRDLVKLLSFLSAGVDSDGRMRTSYNVASTETGRWSSSENAFGGGTNLQFLPEDVRVIFVPDRGYKMAYIDLEQAESRVVSLLSFRCCGDRAYYDACNSPDLHTQVTRMGWRDLPWTGDWDADRKIADRIAYRGYSYRYLAKRMGHGTNYFGKPWAISRQIRVPVSLVEQFQEGYFDAFPGIRRWHREVAEKLQTAGVMTSLLGRVRVFTGRLRDDSTLREAIAFDPQSVVADALNSCLFAIWRNRPPGEGWDTHHAHVLGQFHDAVLVQYPIHRELHNLKIIQEHMTFPITASYGDETITHSIPCEFQVGYNWAKHDPETNPHGLVKWTPHKLDPRPEPPFVPFSVADKLD